MSHNGIINYKHTESNLNVLLQIAHAGSLRATLWSNPFPIDLFHLMNTILGLVIVPYSYLP
jgi:hypothetical protein